MIPKSLFNSRNPPSKLAEKAQWKYIISVIPPNDIIPRVIYKIAKQLNMTNAAVLYDQSFGELHFKQPTFQIVYLF